MLSSVFSLPVIFFRFMIFVSDQYFYLINALHVLHSISLICYHNASGMTHVGQKKLTLLNHPISLLFFFVLPMDWQDIIWSIFVDKITVTPKRGNNDTCMRSILSSITFIIINFNFIFFGSRLWPTLYSSTLPEQKLLPILRKGTYMG